MPALVLRNEPDGARACDAEPAANSARRTDQLLRPGFRTRQRRQAASHCFLPRQPAEGRIRPGCTEYESDVRLERIGGPQVKYVVKLGGATIEDKALLHACGK